MSCLRLLIVIFAAFSLLACTTAQRRSGKKNSKKNGKKNGKKNNRNGDDRSADLVTDTTNRGPDSESFANFDVYKTTGMELSLEVELAERSFRMRGSLDLHYEKQIRDRDEPMFLDVLGLMIKQVKVSYDAGNSKSKVNFKQHSHLPNNGGAALEIEVDSTEDAGTLSIDYVVGPGAAEQLDYELEANTTLRYVSYTSQQQYPVIATFNKPNMARSWIPCQDTVRVKAPVKMIAKVPRPYTALMSGQLTHSQDHRTEDTTTFEYDQYIPVAAQHLTFTMGYFETSAIEDSDRVAVWNEVGAELDESTKENLRSEAESLLEICEDMVGPYVWDQLNIVLLPDQLGYDRERLGPNTIYIPLSLVQRHDSSVDDHSLLIQELSRQMFLSWFGDLITPTNNATDRWLSEGIAQYLSHYATERAVDNGRSVADLLFYDSISKLKALERVDADLKDRRSMTAHKGALFLRILEEKVGGKDTLIGFLRVSILFHVFDTVSQEKFAELFETVFPDMEKIEWDVHVGNEWLDSTSTRYQIYSSLLSSRYTMAITQVLRDWSETKPTVKGNQLKKLKTVQLAHLLDNVKYLDGNAKWSAALTKKLTALLKKSGVYSDMDMFSRWAQSALVLGDESIVRDALKYVSTYEKNPAARAIFKLLKMRAEDNNDEALTIKLKKLKRKIRQNSFTTFSE